MIDNFRSHIRQDCLVELLVWNRMSFLLCMPLFSLRLARAGRIFKTPFHLRSTLSTTVGLPTTGNIVRSPWPKCVISRNETLYSHVFGNNQFDRSKTALIEGISGKRLSYDELLERIGKVGSALMRKGLQKDDVLALVSPNSIEFVIQFFATSAIGCVVSTINPSFTPGEIAYQLKDCGAKYIATVSSILSTVKEAASQAGVPNDKIIILDADGHGEHISFNKLLEDSGSSFPDGGAHVDPDNTACLLYSSGTTGMPKGVMLTHHNLVSCLYQLDQTRSVIQQPSDVLLANLPFFHLYALLVILLCGIRQGASVLILPKFEPNLLLDSISDHRVSHVFLAPPVAHFFANHPLVNQYNLSSVEHMICSGSTLSEQIATVILDRVGKVVRQVYGLTETCVVAVCPFDVTNSSSIGAPMGNTELAVSDPRTGQHRGAGECGEILIRGPQVMKGYLNRPEETSAALKEDGWFHSGDFGMSNDHAYANQSRINMWYLVKYMVCCSYCNFNCVYTRTYSSNYLYQSSSYSNCIVHAFLKLP